MKKSKFNVFLLLGNNRRDDYKKINKKFGKKCLNLFMMKPKYIIF